MTSDVVCRRCKNPKTNTQQAGQVDKCCNKKSHLQSCFICKIVARKCKSFEIQRTPCGLDRRRVCSSIQLFDRISLAFPPTNTKSQQLHTGPMIKKRKLSKVKRELSKVTYLNTTTQVTDTCRRLEDYSTRIIQLHFIQPYLTEMELSFY